MIAQRFEELMFGTDDESGGFKLVAFRDHNGRSCTLMQSPLVNDETLGSSPEGTFFGSESTMRIRRL